MRHYRVPYVVHPVKAKTKARLATTEDGCDGVIELDAPDHLSAMRRLQKSIHPEDGRPIRGRTNIRWFEVKNG